MCHNFPNSPIQKINLYEQVALQLERTILTSYDEGQKLPSEQQLAEEFGVSRTIVREALKILKERGLITSRVGSGAYITKPEAVNVKDVIMRIIQMDSIDYISIFDMRVALETATASRAALHATPEQLKQMEQQLKELEDRTLGETERADRDLAFHVSIAQAANNPLLTVMVEAVGTLMHQTIRSGISVEGGIDDAIMRHYLLLDALTARNSQLAQQRMREHLERSLYNFELLLKTSETVEQAAYQSM